MRRFVVGDEDNLFGIDEDREHENGQSRANLKVPPPIKTIDIHFRERKEVVVVVVQKDVKKSRTFSPSGNPGRVLLTNVITSAPPMAISDRAPMMMIDDDGWMDYKKNGERRNFGGGAFFVSPPFLLTFEKKKKRRF